MKSGLKIALWFMSEVFLGFLLGVLLSLLFGTLAGQIFGVIYVSVLFITWLIIFWGIGQIQGRAYILNNPPKNGEHIEPFYFFLPGKLSIYKADITDSFIFKVEELNSENNNEKTSNNYSIPSQVEFDAILPKNESTRYKWAHIWNQVKPLLNKRTIKEIIAKLDPQVEEDTLRKIIKAGEAGALEKYRENSG